MFSVGGGCKIFVASLAGNIALELSPLPRLEDSGVRVEGVERCFVIEAIAGFPAALPRAAHNTRGVAHHAPISVHRDIALIPRKGRALVRAHRLRCFCMIVAENFLGRGSCES